MKLIVAAAWLVTLFATVTSAEQISDDASIEDVQEWLGQWNLKAAFGDYFQRLQVRASAGCAFHRVRPNSTIKRSLFTLTCTG